MSNLKFMVSVFFVFFTASPSVNAWDDLGHQIVAKIASENLSPSAKESVLSILKSTNPENGSGDQVVDALMVQACTWADEIRDSDHPSHDEELSEATKVLHYVTHIFCDEDEKCIDGIKVKNEPNALSSLDDSIAVLKSQFLNDKEKLQALRLMVHIVGDVHQPFHAGFINDYGGNYTWIDWRDQEEKRLHKIWDEDMLFAFELGLDQFAEMLILEFDPLCYNYELLNTDELNPDVWVKESNQIVKGLYTVIEPGPEDQQVSIRMGKYARGYANKWERDYFYKHQQLVKSRLYQAGIRLAGLLNAIFEEKEV